MNNYLIIINPYAGKRNNSSRIESIQNFFIQSGVEHKLIKTRADYLPEEIVKKEFNSQFTHLILGGGDGTINQGINGLSDFSRPVGILPIGSGNDFQKNFPGIDNWNYLLKDTYDEVDVGLCNGRRFLNGIGAGFDGQIILNMINNRTLLKGHSAYYYHVIKILGTYRETPVQYRIDDKVFEDELLLILAANGTTFGGGFKLAPQAKVNSGFLDVCVVKRIPPYRRFLLLNTLKNGTHLALKEVDYYRASEIEIKSGTLVAQIDGEYAGNPPLLISLEKERLKILHSQ